MYVCVYVCMCVCYMNTCVQRSGKVILTVKSSVSLLSSLSLSLLLFPSLSLYLYLLHSLETESFPELTARLIVIEPQWSPWFDPHSIGLRGMFATAAGLLPGSESLKSGPYVCQVSTLLQSVSSPTPWSFWWTNPAFSSRILALRTLLSLLRSLCLVYWKH